jgi:hypothetical protein
MALKKGDIIKKAVEDLKEIQSYHKIEAEEAHSEADDILCWALKKLGCKQIVDEFDKIYKLYA